MGNVFIDPHVCRILDSKTKKCVLIWYCEDTKAYKMLDPMTEKAIISMDVSCFEKLAWDWSTSHNSTPKFVMVDLPEEKSTRSSIPSIHQPESSHQKIIPLPVTPTKELTVGLPQGIAH